MKSEKRQTQHLPSPLIDLKLGEALMGKTPYAGAVVEGYDDFVDLTSGITGFLRAPYRVKTKIATTNFLSGDWAPLDQSDFISQIPEMMNPQRGLQLEEHFRTAFGYSSKRFSELCERFEKVEAALQVLASKLHHGTQSQGSLWLPIESFAPEPYEAVKPITAVITPMEDGFEAGLFDANLFSSGDTEVEALNNLKSRIVETYEMLEELGDSRLGPGPFRQKKVLSSLIRKAGS
jgi:hypothetical protein